MTIVNYKALRIYEKKIEMLTRLTISVSYEKKYGAGESFFAFWFWDLSQLLKELQHKYV